MKWGSRKFWSAMIWQAVFTVLVAKKIIPPEAYQALTFITLGGYFASNVMDKKFGGMG